MNESPPAHDPVISLIVSMYGVESYLPAFLSSLTAQGDALRHTEVVFVDDGSPDSSAALAASWLATTRVRGTSLRKENGGPSSARNAGLGAATGVWVSFPDPDDVLPSDYLATILDAMAQPEAQGVGLVAANIVYLDDADGAHRDAHPLRGPFQRGTRVIDLEEEPQAAKLSAASSFFLRSVIVGHRLEFDARIRPNFEDGAFICRYHSTFARPALLAVREAHYLYRQRTDGSSLVASSWSRGEKYLDVPRYGWLATLRALHDAHGEVPRWAQYTVLYDMSWYFRYDTQIHTPTRSLSIEARSSFMALVRAALAYISAETITGYAITDLSLQARMALIAMRGDALPSTLLHIWRIDRFRGLLQVKYYFAGDRPAEEIIAGTRAIAPAYAKDRAVVYFGEAVLSERILWIPVHDDLRIRLDGVRRELAYGSPRVPRLAVTSNDLRRSFGSTGIPEVGLPNRRRAGRRSSAAALRRSRRRREARARLNRALHGRARWVRRPWAAITKKRARRATAFRDAWVFMDRDTQAQDNAEHLYRWTRANRPEVNAWFVIRRRSTDWARLKKEGFRLVAFGSTRHKMLLRNAVHVVSSHVDHYVVHPWDERLYGHGRWSYTFLQHGVTKDDISRWLNGKPIALVVAAADAEHQGFVTDGTPYVLTDREAKLTGFPRHDALLAKSRALEDERDLILVMPTWREYLMGRATGRGSRRDLVEDFEVSAFAQHWQRYLLDPRIHALATEHGLRIAFVPHPNLEAHIGRFPVPPDVDIVTYGEADIQSVIARARVLVTDYSSLAFEAAYVRTPVVYFQFDREEFFARHPHRPGYYDYVRDGFGPVAVDVAGAVAATAEALLGTSDRSAEYAARADSFFMARDGRNCERTFAAIEAIRSRVPERTE